MINKIKKMIGLVSEKKPQREGSFDEMTVDMSESNDVRSMHIGSPTIQSSMRISDPYHLELGYTQIMALAAIFLDKPKDLLFVGLGGAAIQKFFYKWYKKANCLTIEINPSAINVAKQFFKIPQRHRSVLKLFKMTALIILKIQRINMISFSLMHLKNMACPKYFVKSLILKVVGRD